MTKKYNKKNWLKTTLPVLIIAGLFFFVLNTYLYGIDDALKAGINYGNGFCQAGIVMLILGAILHKDVHFCDCDEIKKR